MKRKVLFILMGLTVALLVGCKDVEVTDKPIVDWTEEETGFYELLSEEQMAYLEKDADSFYTEDILNEMSYESLNSLFLGTGLELYNQSSGVEKFGIDYVYDESVDVSLYGDYYKTIQNNSDELITLEEAYNIRDKEKNIRLEDFLHYKFEIEHIDTGSNDFYFPVDNLQDVYIYIKVSEENNKVHMYTPFLAFGKYGGKCSLQYERELIDAIIYEEPFYEESGKQVSYIRYGSVTNKFFVLCVKNYQEDEDILYDSSHLLYKNENGSYVEIPEYAFESDNIQKINKNSWSEITVNYSSEGKSLDSGKYMIKIGKDKKGYFYKEIEFEIE